MKKLLSSLAIAATCLSLSVGAIAANADTAPANTTSDWMPHNFLLSGYEIPTAMSYEGGAVTFSGSLNAGIATTGFTRVTPVDFSNFSIDMDLDIPEIDKLSWISIGLLDKAFIDDQENLLPVAQPFNAISGYGYSTLKLRGTVLQLYTNSLLTDNVLDVKLNEKGVDSATGATTENGWKEISEKMCGAIKLNDTWDGSVNLAFTPAEDGGVQVTLNGGEYKTMDENGDYVVDGSILNPDDSLKGFADYFKSNDCYFSLTLMYADGEHRAVSLKVNTVNGAPAADDSVPAYKADKTVSADGISATFKTTSIANFGVYASSIDGLKVTKFGEDDGDYEAAVARANALGMEIADFFRVNPTVGGTTISTKDFFDVTCSLGGDYTEYKYYFINEDGDAQAFTSNFVAESDGKVTLKVDNENISKVVIYGKKPGAGSTDKPSDSSNEEGKKGCGSAAATGTAAAIAIVALGAATLKRKEN